MHPVHNAFNILTNRGFLREEESINTLEAVRMFYEKIGENSRKPTLMNQDVLEFCPMGNSVAEFQAVITLVKKVSDNEELLYHVVRVFIITYCYGRKCRKSDCHSG